jgi:hypothetical protein
VKEKIELMLQVYRERLEKAQRPPIDHALGLQTQAQIAILESLYIYALQEEERGLTQLAPDVCPECGGWGSVAREMNLKIGCGACAANAGKA